VARFRTESIEPRAQVSGHSTDQYLIEIYRLVAPAVLAEDASRSKTTADIVLIEFLVEYDKGGDPITGLNCLGALPTEIAVALGGFRIAVSPSLTASMICSSWASVTVGVSHDTSAFAAGAIADLCVRSDPSAIPAPLTPHSQRYGRQ